MQSGLSTSCPCQHQVNMTQEPFPPANQRSCQSRLQLRSWIAAVHCSSSSVILMLVSPCLPCFPCSKPVPFFFFYLEAESCYWVREGGLTAVAAKPPQLNKAGVTTHYWGQIYICHAHMPRQTENSLLFPLIMPHLPAFSYNYERKFHSSD